MEAPAMVDPGMRASVGDVVGGMIVIALLLAISWPVILMAVFLTVWGWPITLGIYLAAKFNSGTILFLTPIFWFGWVVVFVSLCSRKPSTHTASASTTRDVVGNAVRIDEAIRGRIGQLDIHGRWGWRSKR